MAVAVLKYPRPRVDICPRALRRERPNVAPATTHDLIQVSRPIVRRDCRKRTFVSPQILPFSLFVSCVVARFEKSSARKEEFIAGTRAFETRRKESALYPKQASSQS